MRETRPLGTSWASVVGGWLAAVGTAALLAPGIAAIFSGRSVQPNDLSLAVPVVVGLVIVYLLGGYVAGRMAGYNTSWHGMMTAFFGLFVTLLALLLAAAADQGLLAGVRSLSDVVPGVSQLDLRNLGDTVTFGAILGFLATIFAGWLGGLLAPEHMFAPVPVVTTTVPAQRVTAGELVVEEQRVERKPRFRLLPAAGRKGGETVEKTETEVRETRISR